MDHYPFGETTIKIRIFFYPRAFDAEITFYKNTSGEVDRLVYVLNGVTYEAKKVP